MRVDDEAKNNGLSGEAGCGRRASRLRLHFVGSDRAAGLGKGMALGRNRRRSQNFVLDLLRQSSREA